MTNTGVTLACPRCAKTFPIQSGEVIVDYCKQCAKQDAEKEIVYSDDLIPKEMKHAGKLCGTVELMTQLPYGPGENWRFNTVVYYEKSSYFRNKLARFLRWSAQLCERKCGIAFEFEKDGHRDSFYLGARHRTKADRDKAVANKGEVK